MGTSNKAAAMVSATGSGNVTAEFAHCFEGSTERNESENVRRYNNLVKVLLIEQHVDTMPGSVRILDLGCGNGPDVGKYSRAHRGSKMKEYVGIDFADVAIDEARARYGTLLSRAKPSTEEYEASFYA